MGDIFPGILPDEEDREAFEPVTEIERAGKQGELYDRETLSAAIDAGECPWCDEYEGEYPERHASKAHPEAWQVYKEA